MTTPRSILVDSEQAFAYHLISRCVRRSFLCGKDRRRDYSHRKAWLIERMQFLEQAFAVEIYAYAIMSNHLHLVVYYDPKACKTWSDEEVARRWYHACPPLFRDGTIDEPRRESMIEALLKDPHRLERARNALGSLSTFMKLLKQPIARRANIEDGCTGHFFEQRFYSGVLLDEEAMVDAMRYVDLNPVRAKIARRLADIKNCSISKRLAAQRNSRDRIDAAIAPVFEQPTCDEAIEPDTLIRLTVSTRDYIKQLEKTISWEQQSSQKRQRSDPLVRRWVNRMMLIGHRQRAYGPPMRLKSWIEERGLQMRETPTIL